MSTAEKQNEAGGKALSKHYGSSCSPGQGVVTANNPRRGRGLSTLGTCGFGLQRHPQVVRLNEAVPSSSACLQITTNRFFNEPFLRTVWAETWAYRRG